jgi:hypothetical protein
LAKAPIRGRQNAMIGGDTDDPRVVIAANGGADLIYISDGDKGLAGKIVKALIVQDYVSGLSIEGSAVFPAGCRHIRHGPQ